MVIRSILCIILATIAGILCASFFEFSINVIFVGMGFVLGTGVVLCFYYRSRRAFFIGIAVVFFLFGIFRYEVAVYNWRAKLPADFYESSRELTGVVFSSLRSERSQNIFIETDYGVVLVTTSSHPTFAYGDKVVISGRVDDPLMRYPRRESLWVRGAVATMYFPHIVREESSSHLNTQSILYSTRSMLEGKLMSLYAEPYSALADGMLFGSTNGIDRNIYDAFRRSGTSHILVLSGFNISVVAAFLLFIFRLIFRRNYAIIGAMVGVVLFTIMTGFGSPAVRAAVMAIIALLGYYTGRQYRADVALLWAIFLMLLHNPLLLRWDAGFQLSVAATLGIMYIAPLVDVRSRAVIPPAFFRSMVATTIGAQAAVLPFFLWWGVSVSLWSIVANIFVVPLVPFVMALSAFAVIASFISHSLALLVAFPAFLLMKWQIAVAMYFGM